MIAWARVVAAAKLIGRRPSPGLGPGRHLVAQRGGKLLVIFAAHAVGPSQLVDLAF